MSKHVLALMIEKPQVNEEFNRWPLHIKLLPWFNITRSMSEVIGQFDVLFSQYQVFTIRGGEKTVFGKDVPVFLIELNQTLQQLHDNALNLLDHLELKLEDGSHVGAAYRPYITVRGRSENLQHVELTMYSIDLIEEVKDWPTKVRKSVYRFEFKT